MTVRNNDDIAATLGIPEAYTSRRSIIRRAALAGVAVSASLAVTAPPFRSSATTISEGAPIMSQSVRNPETMPDNFPTAPAVSLAPLVVAPGAGDVMEFSASERFIWKATGNTTDGTFDAFETTLEPGYPGAAEHIHDANDEIFYVLEGAFRLKIGDDLVDAQAGTFAFIPRGMAHTWVNIDDGASKLLTQFVPGGMYGMFEATSELIQMGSPNTAALVAAAGQFNTRLVGPPMLP